MKTFVTALAIASAMIVAPVASAVAEETIAPNCGSYCELLEDAIVKFKQDPSVSSLRVRLVIDLISITHGADAAWASAQEIATRT